MKLIENPNNEKYALKDTWDGESFQLPKSKSLCFF